MLSLLLSIRGAEAADIRGFQIWETVGAWTGFTRGATLLEVEKTNDGSLVRFVFVGLGDFACHRTTVMAWQKRIAGKTPRDNSAPGESVPSESKGTEQPSGRHLRV
jgi:hypothetical protein